MESIAATWASPSAAERDAAIRQVEHPFAIQKPAPPTSAGAARGFRSLQRGATAGDVLRRQPPADQAERRHAGVLVAWGYNQTGQRVLLDAVRDQRERSHDWLEMGERAQPQTDRLNSGMGLRPMPWPWKSHAL
jgi:hypothetical protein